MKAASLLLPCLSLSRRKIHIQKILKAISGEKNPEQRAGHLLALTPYLSPAQFSLSLERIQRIGDLPQQAACLAWFTPDLVQLIHYR